MRHTNTNRGAVDRFVSAGLGFAIALALALGLMAGTAHAGDDYWANQYQQTLQNEQRQAEQRNREAVQQWSQPTHPSWNEQQAQRLQDEKVHDYTLRQTTPSGGMTQKHCYTTGQTTTCF